MTPTTPEVFSYLHHAFLCEVLRGHPSFEDWLAAAFLRLYAHESPEVSTVPANFDVADVLVTDPSSGRLTPSLGGYFAATALLEVEVLDREEPRLAADLPAFLRDVVRDGWSVLCYADKRYVPGTDEHTRESRTHQLLLRADDRAGDGDGDGDGDGLMVHGMGRRGTFLRHRLTVDDAVQAVRHATVGGHRRRVHLLRPRADVRLVLDPVDVAHALGEARAGRGTTVVEPLPQSPAAWAPQTGLHFGLAASGTIAQHGERMLEGSLPYDIRAFHVAMEHKQRLVAAFELLRARDAVPEDEASAWVAAATSLRDRAAAMRFLMLRCTHAGAPPDVLSTWQAQTEAVITAEHALTEAVCAALPTDRRTVQGVS